MEFWNFFWTIANFTSFGVYWVQLNRTNYMIDLFFFRFIEMYALSAVCLRESCVYELANEQMQKDESL